MKRLFDFVISIIGIILLIPFFLIIGLLVSIKLGNPIIFTQIRPGKGCSPFKIYKFRSMTNDMDQNGNLLPNDKRLTKFGRLLRSSSLDELPELFNVLIGNMSLVGPRPLIMEYVPLFNEYQNQRHKVKPGITGWAQIHGRNALTWDEKFDLDIWYVNNKSFLLDLKIIWLTFKIVFRAQGISHKDNVAMPKFTGNNEQSK